MQCNVCREAWPNKNAKVDEKSHVFIHCKIDKGTPRKFITENNVDPCSVPLELSDLTNCEEMLIARAFPMMQVYV